MRLGAFFGNIGIGFAGYQKLFGRYLGMATVSNKCFTRVIEMAFPQVIEMAFPHIQDNLDEIC